MRPSRLPHLLRGSVAASAATFTALLSHIAAGGDLPGWLGIAVPLLLSTMLCVLLAGRRLSLVRLSLAVAASQVLFHTLFVLGAITPAATGVRHQHGAPLVLPPVGDGVVIVADAGMWLSHVIAAAATTLLLHRGERTAEQLLHAARSLVGWVAAAVVRGLILPVETRPRRLVRPAECPARASTGIRVVRQLRRRGPPLPSQL